MDSPLPRPEKAADQKSERRPGVLTGLSREDYDRLKVAAAITGRGGSMSSLVRQLVHDYLESDQEARDIYDLAVLRARKADQRPFADDKDVRAARRAGS